MLTQSFPLHHIEQPNELIGQLNTYRLLHVALPLSTSSTLTHASHCLLSISVTFTPPLLLYYLPLSSSGILYPHYMSGSSLSLRSQLKCYPLSKALLDLSSDYQTHLHHSLLHHSVVLKAFIALVTIGMYVLISMHVLYVFPLLPSPGLKL